MNTSQTITPVVYGYAVIHAMLGGKPMYGIARDEKQALAEAFQHAYSGSELDNEERESAWADCLRRREIVVVKLDQKSYEMCADGGWNSVGFRESTETDADDSDFYVWVEETEA